MTHLINSFQIDENDKLTNLLYHYLQFFNCFEGRDVLFAVITKFGIVYYQGTYTIESTRKYTDILINSNMYIEDFNYINQNSFIINISKMDIINIIHFRNNTTYQLSLEEIEIDKKILKCNVPEFCRNRIVFNTIQYNIHIKFNKKWYKY
jgi:hypothetical protein